MGTLQWPCDSVPTHGARRLHPSGGGVLPPETQRPQVTVAPPHVQRNCKFYFWSTGQAICTYLYLMSNGIMCSSLDLLFPVHVLTCKSRSFSNIVIHCIMFLFPLQITFGNDIGRFDLEVTTFQMAVLFAWNQRPKDRISYESLKLATELPDTELRRTLWVCFNVSMLSITSYYMLFTAIYLSAYIRHIWLPSGLSSVDNLQQLLQFLPQSFSHS